MYACNKYINKELHKKNKETSKHTQGTDEVND